MGRAGRTLSGAEIVRRSGACAFGTLLAIGLIATPAWANTAPDSPTAVAAATGNGLITVTYTAPLNNGGDPITQYTATCNDDVDPVVSDSVAGPTASPITVSPLTIGTSYHCHVVAINTDGTSTPSAETASVEVGVPTTPTAPTVTRGSGTLIVTVTQPADNGSAITSDTAGCTATGGVPGTATGSSPLTVSGVTVGKAYTCHVRATNGVGSSADSPESSPAVVVSLAPAAPTTPTLSSGNGAIIVAFTPGTSGDPVLSNTATCTPTGGSPLSATGASSPLTVNALTNGLTYACHVATTNDIGTGSPSPDASIVAGLPAQPTAPTLIANDSQINVNFTPPSLNGSPPALVPYTAGCLSGNGGGAASGSGNGSPILVSGVTNGKTYTCHVTAHNTVGGGPDSPESAPAIPAGIPDPPPAPTITPGNNLMQVAFTAPADNGGAPITAYNITCTSSDGGATGTATATASPVDVTNLTNGNTYTCDVSATNSAGTSSISDESAPAVADAVPGAPSKPTLTGGPSRIIVSFALPSGNGDQIQRTTATCTSSNGGITRSAFTQPEDLGETYSPITVLGVTNGKTYTCKVTATNDVGTGPASPVSAAVIPRGAPGAPTGVTATSGTATGAVGPVNVSFIPGGGNGSPITSYRATCTDLKNGLKYTKALTRSPIQLTGLTTGHGFNCVAYDIGPGGTSVASAISKVTLGAPGRPTISRVQQKSRALTLSLLAPPGNGKPISFYTARCTSTNGGALRGAQSFAGSIVVKNLSLGASYTCTVTATNARGAGAAAKVGPVNISN